MIGDRAHPSLWDHQRHGLIRLSRLVKSALEERLQPQPGDVVVDFGCGDMPYEGFFTSYGATYIGCDIAGESAVKITLGEPIPIPSASANLVVSFQVLEHVWDLNWYLGECLRVLRPGGHILLSTHGTWLYHPHPTDFRRWTRDGLTRELETRGFCVDHISGLIGPLAWTTQFRLLGYREILRRIPLVRATVLPLLTIAMNVRMEIEDAITPDAIRQSNACIYVVEAHRA